MTFRKSNPYLSLVNSYLIDSPQPTSINYWWNLGSLLGLCLVIQLASGIFLAMHYSSNIELAFNSVEHIMRDVNAGWLIRYIHANGASFFFICMYLHIGKALYYGSYKSPRTTVWIVGVIIFILTMATAFMGYLISSPKSYIYKPKNYIPSLNRYNRFNNNISSFKKFNNNNISIRYLHTKRHQDITDPNIIFNKLGIKLVDWWDNLDDHNNRLLIQNSLKNKSGIYIIINKINNYTYIGSGSTNKLYTKFSNHLLHHKNSNNLIKRSINKYGLNNFIFGILEYYPNKVNVNNNKELIALETSYISLIMPQYNILTEASNNFGYRYSEIDLSNYKSSLTLERKELLKLLQNKNILYHKNNLSLNNSTFYIDTQYNNSNIYKNDVDIKSGYNNPDKTIKIYKYNELLCSFKNINKAANYLCCSPTTIQESINLGRIYIPNIFIEYLNNDFINKYNNIKDNNDDLFHVKIKSSFKNRKGYTLFNITDKEYIK